MFRKFSSLIIIVCFFLTTLGPLPKAHADTILGLPQPGTMVNLSPAYEPALIKGLTVHKDNPFLFDFIVDTGHSGLMGDALKKEGDRLVKYFFACLTIPEKDLWVNLSPYEKDRMVPQALGQTALGRDLLAEDYILKQLTASLIYPEKDLGKSFWDRVYAKAQQMYGTTQIPVNTFNKVWIVADKASVYEHGQTAFVVSGHLKVMLEQDYLAMSKHVNVTKTTNTTSVNNLGSQIVREIILPEIDKEVNKAKNFSTLRQIFNSLILASWYKNNLRQALLTQAYADKGTVKGINLADPSVKEQIFQQYLKAYKKGVFNYIKEDAQPDGQTIPRKYFSGGFVNQLQISPASFAQAESAVNPIGDDYAMKVVVNVNNLIIPDVAMKVTPDSPLEDLGLKKQQNKAIRENLLRIFKVPNGDVSSLMFNKEEKASIEVNPIFSQLVTKRYLAKFREDNPYWGYFIKDIAYIKAHIETDFPDNWKEVLPILEKKYEDLQNYNKRRVTIKELIQFSGKQLSIPQKSKEALRAALAKNNLYLAREKPLGPEEKATLETDVNILGLGTRASNVFNNANITTIGQLVEKKSNDLRKYRNLGEVALNEIKEKLKEHGFYLKGEGPELVPSGPAVTLESGVDVLGLSVRASNLLNNANITTIGQLVEKNADYLLKYRNFSKMGLNEIRNKLKEHGFYLAGETTGVEGEQKMPVTLESSVSVLALSAKPSTVLSSENIETIGQLINKNANDLRKYRNLGPASLEEIRGALAQYGFHLAGDIDDQRLVTLESSVSVLTLSAKPSTVLSNYHIETIGQLVNKNVYDLRRYRNLGPASLEEIRGALAKYGFHLKGEAGKREKPVTLESSVDVLGLSVRSHTVLYNASIETIGQLVGKSDIDLRKYRNMGRGSLNDVRTKLKKHGFYLSGERPVIQDDVLNAGVGIFDLEPVDREILLLSGLDTVGKVKEKSVKELLRDLVYYGRPAGILRIDIDKIRRVLLSYDLYLKGQLPSWRKINYEFFIMVEKEIDTSRLAEMGSAYVVIVQSGKRLPVEAIFRPLAESPETTIALIARDKPKNLGELLAAIKKQDVAMKADQAALMRMPVIAGIANPTRGGIDLNTANMGMTVTKDANGGVKINFDPAMIARIRQQGIQSAVPVIIDVHMMSMADIRPLSGFSN